MIGFLLFALAVQVPAPTPSFDCAQAKEPIAQTICADPELAAADSVMARLFSAARASAFGHGPSGELAAQQEWIKQRKDCRVVDRRIYKSRSECLMGRYDSRNHELAVATLFSEPELSVQTLRKLDPEAAPLYEAIVLYANGPKAWTWNEPSQQPQMLRLLEPYFDRFGSDENLSFGRDILAGDGIKSAADTVKSEEHFIEFLQITSAYLRDDPIPRPLPCAAILRRAELVGATSPVFGSTLDSFIFRSDCATTLPPLPAFEKLIQQINDKWPNCEGTIRFSAYRMFDSMQDEARVATLDEIRELARSIEGKRGVRMPRLRGVSSAQIGAAIAELTNYYQTYQKASGSDARMFARFKVHDLLASGHSCGE